MSFNSLFKNKKPLIACIHLMPLPGSPGYSGNMDEVFDIAMKEVEIYKRHSVDGLIVENFRDVPFYPDKLPAETIAAMSSITREIVKVFQGTVGVNALRNDAQAAMAIAVATQANFIRVNVHTGAAITDQGLIQGKAFKTLRLRESLKSNVLIFADVDVKHAVPLGNRGLPLETKDLTERGLADAIIVSGDGTGKQTELTDIKTVKENTHLPVILGSGVTPDNLKIYYEIADGFIVGSYFKKDGIANNRVDEERVIFFVNKMKKKSKFVLDIRDLWPESALALGELNEGIIAGILKKIELFLYRKADLITIAVPGFRKYITDLKISNKKIIDLPNGANVELFSPAPNSKKIREKFSWEEKFLILFSGNHGLAQGLEYLLKTADSLKDFEDLRFIFIGDGVVKEKLIKMKQKMQLDSVIFLDKVDRDQMPSFISAMDVCLVPLIKHPLFLNALPSKMFEYMACEKPVIVSIEGEAKDLIKKSGAGVFVEPENISQLKNAILNLYEKKRLGTNIGKKGRYFVSKHYCRTKIAKRIESVLKNLSEN